MPARASHGASTRPLPLARLIATLIVALATLGATIRHANPVHAAVVSSHALVLTSALNAVSCFDTSRCYAAGAGGVVSHTSDGGANWDVNGTPTFSTLYGIACASANACVAVGAGGAIAGTSNGGATWTAQSNSATVDLKAVSCLSTTSCYAVGAGGTIVATTNGASWSAQASGTTQNLFGIACPGGTTCVAVGAAGTILLTTDGSTWLPQASNTTAQLNAVACVPFTTTCYAVGGGSVFTKTSDGTSWSAGTILQNGFTFNAISCAAASTCVAAGQFGFLFMTTDGSTWNSQVSHTTLTLSGIACPSTVTCFVTEPNGTILATVNAGTNWNAETPAYAGQVDAVACPSATVCYAAGGVIGGTTDGGSTWSLFTTAQDSVLHDIACPSTSNCAAVGSSGRIYSTADGGASWTLLAPFPNALNGVACPTVSVCYAVGAGGLIETNAGGSWRGDNSPTIQSLAGVACTGATACVAVGAAGTVVRTLDGTHWSVVAVGVTVDLVSIACAPGGVCYALPGLANSAFLKSIDGGASWSGGSFAPAPTPLRMACPAMPVCLAPAWNGVSSLILSSGDQGNTWSQQSLGSTERLLSVACPTLTLCAFGTDAGHIFLATSPATTLSLGVSPNPAAAGQPLTLTATLSACPSSPGGSVAFFDGLALLGSAPISAGQAQLSTGGLAGGAHQLSASYGGDANCGAAVSNTLNEGVAPATPTPTAPPPGASGLSTTPTLSWTNPAGAASFNIAISDTTASQTLAGLSSAAASLVVPVSEGLVLAHQYSWSVQACNAIGCSPFSSAISFTTAAAPPGAVQLLSPLEGATNVSFTPTLSWSAPSGAIAGTTQYTAYIWDPQLGVMKFQQSTSALSIGVPAASALQGGVFYYWTVQACNGGACGPLARWLGFTTAAALGAPGLSSPLEGATNVSTTPTVQWTAAGGAANGVTQYTVFIWDPNPGAMVFQQTTTALSLSVPPAAALQGSRFYYYTVQACDGASCGPLARWEGFTTAASSGPGVVTLTQPPEGATGVSLTPALQWAAPTGAVSGTTRYTASVWDPAAGVMRFQQTTTALDIDVPGSAGLVLGHFYYWTVQACNGTDCGPLARWEGFTTVSGLGAPLLRGPAEGATGVGVTPTINWLAPSGASPGTTQYTVFVWDPAVGVMKFQQTTTALLLPVPFSAGLVSGHFYYYTVQACNGGTCGPLARWEGFTS